MEDEKISQLALLLESLQAQLAQAQRVLREIQTGETATQETEYAESDASGMAPIPYAQVTIPPLTARPGMMNTSVPASNGHVVEGLFDGQNMVGPDGKMYNVAANYASKSKLVEGDAMKLTISSDGSFIYKQIGPVDRKRQTGKLQRDGSGYVMVSDAGRSYKLLLASVTYFKGQAGDSVIAFVPAHGQSAWAAVEHIIPQDQVTPELMSVMLEGDEGEENIVHDAPATAVEVPLELHQGDEGLLPSGEEGLLPE